MPSEFSAMAEEVADAKIDACFASLVVSLHLAVLMMSFALPISLHNASFHLTLHSRHALMMLVLLIYDLELLAAASPQTLIHLMLLSDTLSFSFFGQFLMMCPQLVHLALPNFVGIPPGAGKVPMTAILHLAMLDASPGLAAVLAPGQPVQCVMLCIASTL
jgi:hypothetical protein